MKQPITMEQPTHFAVLIDLHAFDAEEVQQRVELLLQEAGINYNHVNVVDQATPPNGRPAWSGVLPGRGPVTRA